jgi:hypothetical protein
MKRLLHTFLFGLIVSLSGCTWYDTVFGFLGDEHYTGGGTTSYEKKAHYDAQVRAFGGDP